LPRTIISNRRLQFVSQFMRDLLKLLRIKGNPSTAYHPQTDRQTEWMNQELEQYLKTYINYQQDDWLEWSSLVEFTYNNQEHSAMKCSPFFANYRRYPNKGMNHNLQVKIQSAIELAKQMWQIHEEVRVVISHVQRLMKTQYNKQQKDSCDYQ
jgi:hypothetical protein